MLPRLPVVAGTLVGMFFEVQSPDFSVHYLLDLSLWNPTQPSKHGQQLPASETLNQGIKLLVARVK